MEVETPKSPSTSVKKVLDSSTAEILALTVFRALFGSSVFVPMKMKGIIDMDLVIKDGNVLLDLNDFQLSRPELTVWRITFAFRGKPVIEYGRGIKKGMKVHYAQMLILLLSVWKNNRNRIKAMARGEAIASQELLTISKSGSGITPLEEATN